MKHHKGNRCKYYRRFLDFADFAAAQAAPEDTFHVGDFVYLDDVDKIRKVKAITDGAGSTSTFGPGV